MEFAKRLGVTIAVMTFGFMCIVGARGQQSARTSASPSLTTNWVGYLVAGQFDIIDRITTTPSPAVVRQVEIGLRSDGVVIWREAREKEVSR